MAATLDLPDTTPIAYAMFAHCFTGSRFTPAAARVSKTLADSGIACLRFDFPGLGQSEGEFSETTFSSNVDDIVAASEWLREHYSAPQLLIGHSLGGAASLKAATKIASLKAVATLGAPFDPAHAVLHFADRISDVDEHGAVTLALGGRDVTISRSFLEDLAELNPEDHLRKLRKPLLLLHSPIDQTVGVDNAQLIFRVTRYPKSLMTLDKADHLLTKEGAAQRAAQIIRTWVEPYLEPENADDVIPEGVVEATTIKASKYGAAVRGSSHSFIADRAKSQGGKSLGSTPASLFASALAASNAQSIKQAAIEKRITALKDVKVTISRAVSPDTSTLKFRRKISLIGTFTEAEHAELMAATKNCSLEQMLSPGIMIDNDEA